MNLGQPNGLTLKNLPGVRGGPREGVSLFWRTTWKLFTFMAFFFVSNSGLPLISTGKKRAHKLKKNARDTGWVSLGHPAGQTGVYRPVSQKLPVIYYRKTARKGHFCRDIGRVSQGHPAIEGGFQKFYVIFSLFCLFCSRLVISTAGEVAGKSGGGLLGKLWEILGSPGN